MATDKLQINEGTSGKYVPVYTITEDAGTKYLGRVVLNSSAGVEQTAIAGVTTDAAVTTDASGTIHQYLRGIAKAFLAFVTFVTGQGSDLTTNAMAVSVIQKKTLKRVAGSCASSGDNTLIAAVGGKCLKVFSYNLQFNGTVNSKFTDGASGTQLSCLWNGTSGMNIMPAAMQPPNYLFKTSAGNALILNLSGAVTVQYEISYSDDDAS
jgi:hypothetical protein